MVEAQAFTPDDETRKLIQQYLGDLYTIDPGYKSNVTLKKEEAIKRKGLVEEVEYDFQLAIRKGKFYLGKAVINFYLRRLPKESGDLFLDFCSLAITELLINDKHLKGSQVWKNQRIQLAAEHVQLGWNTVSVRYINQYNTNRIGLHTYTDSSDGKQYLYSQFEAFHCYNVFPVFDQPNMKAKMSLCVTCPQDWKAVSNGKDIRYDNAKVEGQRTIERHNIENFLSFYDGENCALYEFEQTPKISCYLYAICAGEYRVYTDYDAHHTPQRVFVRESLADNLNTETVFGVTKTTI